jgi:5-methyltetrahydropteroyltriglutamate--homocysteine methyltransferase
VPHAIRADHVGSFLRPAELKQARIDHQEGRLTLDELRSIEDRAIDTVLAMQHEVGVDVSSDGEFRRGGWATDFSEAVDGYVQGNPAVTVFNRPRPIIGEKLRAHGRLTAHEAGYLVQHAARPFKMTMPAPSYVLARGYQPEVTDRVYGSRAAALFDVASIVRAEIEALVAEGVPYIQLDNPHYPDYLMADRNAAWRSAGVDPDAAIVEDIEADNLALAAIPRGRGVVAAMHLCRGNVGRGPDEAPVWHTSGSYEAIAERVFGGVQVDRWLLEYDGERAGDFSPLRYMPPDRTVVLGLVTTKSGVLESRDDLLRRVDEASRYVDTEQLALSPQCGFASTLPGNPLTSDEQKRKLELVVATAREVWG